MGKYIIKGEKKLCGEVRVSGSKNATLPILTATLITGCESVIKNCPNITDVEFTCQILKDLGCSVKKEKGTIIVNSKDAINKKIDKEKALKMRSSVLFLGVLLGKYGSAIIGKPGGCAIGKRPIDIHLDALKKMGMNIIEHETYIECYAEKLVGTKICLPIASVGATENIMIAGVFAKGLTVIKNAAKEPEIVALENYLKKVGVNISGAGTSEIIIEGCKNFFDCEFEIIPDRIEAGTFLAAAAATKGEIFLKKVNGSDMVKTLEILSNCGCNIKKDKEEIYLKAPKKIKSIPLVTTDVYPYFPTDMQPIVMTMLTISQGTSIIIEQMFENRFAHVSQLNKMGAKISSATKVSIIEGVKKLKGCEVSATDLRAGAALIIAGLSAKGETIVNNGKYVLRGYENFHEKLQCLGADIILENTNDGD